MAGGTELRIGFLGAGRMATALTRGWLHAGLCRPENVRACDPVPSAREAFARETGALAGAECRPVMDFADVIVIAVKPQYAQGLMTEIRPFVRQQLIISVMAGVTLETLSAGLGAEACLIRVMPNTPSLVGASAAGYSAGANATDEQIQLVERLFNSVGQAVFLGEKLLDAVTGLSGSGPGYVYLMIEAMADGGVKVGLPRDIALKLAAADRVGAAKMVLETGQHPAVLRDAVASPGGTTIAGLHALERGGVRAALMDAVVAATSRARELGGA